MKTNILKNNAGDVGIGTLIIFIAMVLVAAVAAAVLIQTSGILQQKAQSTGKEATAEVSSNLKIVSVLGMRNAITATDNVENMDIVIELSAGGADIDFSKAIIKYINETRAVTLSWDAATSDGTHFTYTEDRDPSGTNTPVLSQGDLGVVRIDLGATVQSLIVRKKGTIQIIPETGTMITKDVVAPSTFGTKSQVQLFP